MCLNLNTRGEVVTMKSILLGKKIGFHLRISSKEDVEPLLYSLEEFLLKRGVNCLVLEINTGYQFTNHPELSEGTLSKVEANQIVDAAKKFGVEIIPLFECLGHQGWGGTPNSLLRVYPEFDETPHISYEAKWPEIYCRSWCASNDDVYKVVFSLIDEIIEDFEPRYFHVGMDEVFIIADDRCPRCRGKEKAKLFTDVVNRLYNHIKIEKGIELMIWGDRLINSQTTSYSQWEADKLGIWPAIDMIPKDIIIADWHYENMKEYVSVEYFLNKGFKIWPSCWKDKNAAKKFFEYAISKAKELNKLQLLFGFLITGWNLTGRSIYEVVKNFENYKKGKEIPEKLKDTFDVLDTLDTVYNYVFRS